MNERRMTTQDVLDAIARERGRLSAAVDSLGSGVANVPVTAEGWTAKDVLAHCIHWVTQVAFGLGVALEPPVYMMEERRRREAAGVSNPPMPTGAESNALAVAFYQDWTFERVRSELDGLVDALAERASARSDDQMNATDAVPWLPGRPLWHIIGGETFLHWPEHSEAIERAAAEASR